ncbi:hypothetical protein B0A49_05453 [Cryomyces minteri]|uniref:DUF3824 domain-containing protein n=1 Tax=Cryomyces minteri TaxID=331657 RepID=A0A4V5NFE3_9PEZI|nr:hypothetical protein B0A49_05453 [Cryomyces minteri]
MSVIYKERERDREWDTESSRGAPRFTTVRRYRVNPERSFEGDRYEEDKQIVIREREREVPPREVRQYRFERDIERDPPSPRQLREYRFERDVERAPSQRAPSPPSPPRVREWRFEREVEREPRELPQRSPYELEKYSKSTEYFSRPDPPIIIRQEPQQIIIREAPRKPIIIEREQPQYEIVERNEVPDNRQLVRREEPPDEDYYFERTTREVDRGPRRDDDLYEEREYRRGPKDSPSQHGDDRYSSDDEYYRRETRVSGGRDGSPHHKRHLAEGVIAGIGAAELVRHHRKQQGEDPGHRGRQLIGSAALGAVGAEVITRARSRYRETQSLSRSRSSSRGGRRRDRYRKNSRSRSRTKTLIGLGTVAAIGALAGYAARNRGNNKQVANERRSRSRRRRSSVGGHEERAKSESKHRDPQHRNTRMAQAGLAAAAAAGLLERARSKSRAPIVASGLGAAALAGLYEKNKARKEEKADVNTAVSLFTPTRFHVVMVEDVEAVTMMILRSIVGGRVVLLALALQAQTIGRTGRNTEAAPAPAGAGVEPMRLRRDKNARGQREKGDVSQGDNIDPYAHDHSPDHYSPLGYPPEEYYPQTNNFPPPPNAGYAPPADYTRQAPYNPSEFPPPPGMTPQPQLVPEQFGHPVHHPNMTGEALDPHLGQYPPPREYDPYPGDERYRGRGNDPENMV